MNSVVRERPKVSAGDVENAEITGYILCWNSLEESGLR